MSTWQLHEAKARFSELLDAALSKGPQIVTRRGVEAAVLIPISEWRRLKESSRPSLKALLLAPGARSDNLTVSRRSFKWRKPVKFS
jgi:prevent-host-death family protein